MITKLLADQTKEMSCHLEVKNKTKILEKIQFCGLYIKLKSSLMFAYHAEQIDFKV